MKKRYQVFVSSTFLDLQDERREIMHALLELRCIPAGMELFPASNDEQWKLIKRVIDDSDYYIVIVAGRYGSVHTSGTSYTEMEYQYALESGKPVLGFLHEDVSAIASKHCESTPEGKTKLQAFRDLVGKKTIKHYKNPHDLGSKVSRSIINLIEEVPATGWVRADFIPNEEASLQIIKLQQKIGELETAIATSANSAPKGAEGLAQGDDRHIIKTLYSLSKETGGSDSYYGEFRPTWNEVLARIGPVMIDECTDRGLKAELDKWAVDRTWQTVTEANPKRRVTGIQMDDQAFQTIKVQLKALGLIQHSLKKRSVTNQGTYWSLTPYGETTLTALRAIKRS
jgi:hypothetical protein